MVVLAPSSSEIVRLTHPPDVLFTVAVQVRTLGIVHVVNFHREPGTKPSGRDMSPGLVTKTGKGEFAPI